MSDETLGEHARQRLHDVYGLGDLGSVGGGVRFFEFRYSNVGYEVLIIHTKHGFYDWYGGKLVSKQWEEEGGSFSSLDSALENAEEWIWEDVMSEIEEKISSAERMRSNLLLDGFPGIREPENDAAHG